MSELKPCPFCGGEVKMGINKESTVREYFVGCMNCHIRLYKIGYKRFYTEAEAIAAWNSRAERTCKPIIEPWDDPTEYDAYCGNCNYPLGDGELEPWNYCPNCGCKVVGE